MFEVGWIGECTIRKKKDGILFQDLPNSEDLLVEKLYYRKRIQLVAYNLEIINKFTFLYDGECA